MNITLDNLQTLLNAIDILIDRKIEDFENSRTLEKLAERYDGSFVYSINTEAKNLNYFVKDENFYTTEGGGTCYDITVVDIADRINNAASITEE